MNILKKIEAKEVKSLLDKRSSPIPSFKAGDTLQVEVEISEMVKSKGKAKAEEKVRYQAFEGVCIARHQNGIGSSFTLRKMSGEYAIERVFPLYSPLLGKINVLRRGRVRRAKLYYLRGLSGKKARIAELPRKATSQKSA